MRVLLVLLVVGLTGCAEVMRVLNVTPVANPPMVLNGEVLQAVHLASQELVRERAPEAGETEPFLICLGRPGSYDATVTFDEKESEFTVGFRPQVDAPCLRGLMDGEVSYVIQVSPAGEYKLVRRAPPLPAAPADGGEVSSPRAAGPEPQAPPAHDGGTPALH